MMKLVVLLALSSIASSKRVVVEQHTNAEAANKGVADYIEWQLATIDPKIKDDKGTCPGCKDIIADGLLDGIFQAGFLESSAWDSETMTLTAILNPEETDEGPGHLYGEIASASRMPVFWSLDKVLKFVFLETETKTKEVTETKGVTETKEVTKKVTTVTMEGIHTEPAAQGVGLYEEFMKDKSEVVDASEANLKVEQDAAFKYLYDWWWNKKDVKVFLDTKAKAEKTNKGSGDSLVLKATDQVGKLTPILNSLYGSFTVRKSIGSQMAGIFYQLATVCPSTITTFNFFNDAKDGSARVSATTVPYFDDASVYARYGFLLKSQVMGAQALLDAKSTMAIAEAAAKSGMNFAKMMAYGNPLTKASMEDKGISAGDPSAIANLFSFCAGSIPGENPTCSGKKTRGRVAWGKSKPSSMTAHRYQNAAHQKRSEDAAAEAAVRAAKAAAEAPEAAAEEEAK